VTEFIIKEEIRMLDNHTPSLWIWRLCKDASSVSVG